MFANHQRAALRVLTLGVSLLATAGVAAAQIAVAESDALLTEAERAEAARLLPLMDAALSGEGATDLVASLRWDFLKAQEGQVYVPFTLSLNPETTSQSVTVYVRLAPAGMVLTPPPAPVPGEPVPPVEPPSYPFEDVHFIDMRLSASGDYLVRRAFAVPPGSYDLYIGIKDSELVETDSVEVRSGVLKRTVDVPDLWGGQFTTSSIFVTERVEPIPAPLSPEQQRSDPYAIGSARIVPRDVMQYEKTDTLSFLLFIYNPQLAEQKPNVTVEYNFHRRTASSEEFFNATTPQTLSAETLPPAFDMAAGHQLSAGQNVPLSAFPEGVYRLEINVIDNEAEASISRNVNFTIVGS
ncbi:MAG: hypothetical protein QGF21_02715 [Vicinamibacterales bacterium]|jgi:hypothetical protein|nr:hypothetical protein [Acidobacteriota bacterium]MDP7472852.1 hypothetical protein [Vicinamibacterales bacterium]MDP7670839.1 hypothetical protein [Vicinamibacterales bacterium]HJO37846.1 hypothetical protein [Vicinamibacterales bacterium]|tara:strand:+ start:260 stop:1318 length:1059 start_codon:yes stop_codon:yes gene_type:complete